MGMMTLMLLVPCFGGGTTWPAPPMVGLIPGTGPGWKIKTTMLVFCLFCSSFHDDKCTLTGKESGTLISQQQIYSHNK
jgi:hypothetical protein